MKILFIDDSLDTRQLFELVFRMKGYEAYFGTNGCEAIEAVRNSVFDVAVIDVEMPHMNGWDALRKIRRIENGARLPVILFTAYRIENAMYAVREAGGNLLLYKPIVPDELIGEIENLLAERAAH